MGRIDNNERRLDNLNKIVSNLDNDLNELEKSFSDYKLLNKYYGSKSWFKDKDNFEKGIIKNIKAGVLSEDAIWNLDENISDLISRMVKIINIMKENK